ncbi:MAG: hypothetical protein A2W11_15070 [Ignavibacteria bacterium RBG_16_35_7]|nr:MAG: hypothetical protein A2W11_15070 [Ignavibacteria bacterium RBG_16_35_7]
MSKALFTFNSFCLFSFLIVSYAQTNREQFAKALADDSRYTNAGNIGLSVTNFGMYGSGWVNWPSVPSCEYPLSSGIEHLFAGGLWVGGFIQGDPNPHVTTAAVDAATISSNRGGGFEFTNSQSDNIVERSSLLDSRFYNPDAISHQDFTMNFSDTNTIYLSGQLIPEHVPMDLAVHQETYSWNFPFADFFVILNFTIKNVSSKYLDSVYVGLWTDAVVRNTKITGRPSGSAFYLHGGNGYIDSLAMAYEFDVNGDPGFTDSYVGVMYLGSTPNIKNFFVSGNNDTLPATNFNTWTHSNTTDPNFFAPQDDPARYRKMQGYFGSNSRYGDGIDPTSLKAASNRSITITRGYYRNIAPGDSVNVVFAIVCAKKYGTDEAKFDTDEQRSNLKSNADWALRAYHGNDKNRNGVIDPGEDIFGDGKIHRYILPAPPNSPVVKVIPENNKATIYWDKRAEDSVDPISGAKDFAGYRVYRTQSGFDITENQNILNSLVLMTQVDSAGSTGFNTGFSSVELAQPVTFPNDPTNYYYKVEIPNLLNGWQYLFTVTAFDKGDPPNNLDALESSLLVNVKRILPGTPSNENNDEEVAVYPNPYYGNAIWDGSSERLRKIYFFNLPVDCEITIYTLAGDIVKRMDHNSEQNGSDIRWFEQYAGDGKQQFSGGEHAWDLITDNDQAIATGLYLFSVKNNRTGNIKIGKFLIIK